MSAATAQEAGVQSAPRPAPRVAIGDLRRPQAPPPATGATPLRAAGGRSWSAEFFILSMAAPIVFYFGPLRFAPYRVILVALTVPLILRWLGGGAGRIRFADIAVLLFAAHGALGYIVLHGAAGIEPAGIWFVETFGAYLMGRVLIRSPAAFVGFVRTSCLIIAFLSVFAMIEAVTGRLLIADLLKPVFRVLNTTAFGDMRLGLHRAFATFEHPILYGVFCAMPFALAWYALGRDGQTATRARWAAIPAFGAFWSLSMGAWLPVILQAAMIAWDHATRRVPGRWLIIVAGFVAVYVAIDILSNRTPIHVMTEYLLFSKHNGYVRIMIWEYGLADAMNHPLFGRGLGSTEWVRPAWMPPSVDAFWVVLAVRGGMVLMFLGALAFAAVIATLCARQEGDPLILTLRRGMVISIIGVSVAISTVHLWGATYALLMFYLGAGIWTRDFPGEAGGGAVSVRERAPSGVLR